MIAELRSELDEASGLILGFEEYVEDYNGVLERWQQAFGMVLNEDGKWTWQPFWDK